MLTPTSRIPQVFKILALFSIVFAWFFCTAWYRPAVLVISGNAPDKDSVLEVSWESGGGANSYEHRQFLLDTISGKEDQNHSIIIRNTGDKSPASLSSEVVCERIALDGRDFDLTPINLQRKGKLTNQTIKLTKRGEEVRLDLAAKESIELKINTNNHSGKVEIIVDGKAQTFDLYLPQDNEMFSVFRYWIVGPTGEYRVRMEMPRYPLKSITVANGKPQSNLLVDHIGIEVDEKTSVLFAGKNEILETKSFHKISPLQKRYFHKVQFVFQIFFSLLTTWFLAACWRFSTNCKATGGLFFGKRKVFWWFFLPALSVFSLWLLAFWPGVMSIDSLKVWRAALLPEVLINDHPLLNVVYYRYLSGVWNNPAIVPVLHICMTSALIAYTFYAIYRHGVSLKYLVPFYLLTITSLPIGLYNTLLWKDIPFAVLIVFWAFLLCQLYQKKREEKHFLLTKEQVLALFLSVLALAFTRHNGLIYLAVIPIYLVLLRLVPKRIVLIIFLAGSAVLLGGLLFLGRDKLIMQSNYLFSQGAHFLGGFVHKSPAAALLQAWRNYWGIFNINQKDSAWDLFHFFLHDRFSYPFLMHAGWNDIYRYLPETPLFPWLTAFAMRLYRLSYMAPFVYLSWNSLYFLVLYPLSISLFRILPLTALFSSFILIQILTLLVVVDVMNWRYYYFAFFGGYLLIPMILLDLHNRSEKRTRVVGGLHEI